MKKTLVIFVVLSAAVLITADAALAAWAEKRQAHQRSRIAQGVHTGSLTLHETARVAATQRHINRTKKHVLSDGVVTRKEKVVLDAKQDAASGQIYRLKHNNRER